MRQEIKMKKKIKEALTEILRDTKNKDVNHW